MIQFAKILHDQKSSAFLSFLIGLGIIVLFFHKPFGSQQYLSLPVADVQKQVVRQGGKCYSYTAEDSLCPSLNKDGRRSN